MIRPARLKPGQPDPLSDAFAASYAEGLTVQGVAHRHSVHKDRVRRALHARPGFAVRTVRFATFLQMERRAQQAQATLDEARDRRVDLAPRLAAGTSCALHALRARVRIAGPVAADDTRIAAAHAAGLTLDDIAEVFAVPPAEAVRAIAAHAGR